MINTVRVFIRVKSDHVDSIENDATPFLGFDIEIFDNLGNQGNPSFNQNVFIHQLFHRWEASKHFRFRSGFAPSRRNVDILVRVDGLGDPGHELTLLIV